MFTKLTAWGEPTSSDFKFAELPAIENLNYAYVEYPSLHYEQREGGETIGKGYVFDKKYFVEDVREKEIAKKVGGTFVIFQLICQEIRTIEPLQVGSNIYIDIAVKKDSEVTAKSIYNRFKATLEKGWLFIIIPPKPKSKIELMMELYKPLQLEAATPEKIEAQDNDDLPF